MWFSKSKGTSVALIDINSSSVAGAFVRLEEGKSPALCYTVRIPLRGTGSVLNTLEEVGNRLVREGGPALRATVGSGSVDRVLVSFGSPWQEATVETKKVQKPEPFTYTRSFTVDLLSSGADVPGKNVTRTVIATLLNGYLTTSPYGKQAKNAEVVVLTTSLDEEMVANTLKILRACFHTHDVSFTSFLEPAYHAIQSLYPHEKDFLLLSVTNQSTEAMSVKRGHLLDAGSVSCGDESFRTKECIDPLSKLLRQFATHHALPRTVFVLSDRDTFADIRDALNESALHALWLSDTPVTALPLEAAQFSGAVATRGSAEGDARLAILALTAKQS